MLWLNGVSSYDHFHANQNKQKQNKNKQNKQTKDQHVYLSLGACKKQRDHRVTQKLSKQISN